MNDLLVMTFDVVCFFAFSVLLIIETICGFLIENIIVAGLVSSVGAVGYWIYSCFANKNKVERDEHEYVTTIFDKEDK